MQEDRSLLVAIESIEDHEIPEGAAPISRKTKKRHRADVMPGSSIRFEALPPSEGKLSLERHSPVSISHELILKLYFLVFLLKL